MRVPFRLLDVFADTPFAGNQLCVVPDVPDGLDAETMLTLAREIGFSETTFVTAVRDDGYDVRIFTPDGELPFAGHPTIGTAFVLVSEGGVSTSPGADVGGGRRAGRGRPRGERRRPCASCRRCSAPRSSDRARSPRAAGLEPADLVDGLPIVAVSTGIAHLMVPVRDEATLRGPNATTARVRTRSARPPDAESLYLFAVRGDGDVMARMFDRWDRDRGGPRDGLGGGSARRLPVASTDSRACRGR